MLGAIAGDIIGSRFEGYAGPPRDFPVFQPTCFTDDSVCALAVADALLGERDFAASLRAFVRRHPARGYGGMFLDWALTDDSPAYGSWGNGSPMRVAAVGWLARDEAEALELAAAQAAFSHDHPDAIAAAQAVALAFRWRVRACHARPFVSGSSRTSPMTWRRNAPWLEVVSIFRLRAPYRRQSRPFCIAGAVAEVGATQGTLCDTTQ